MLFPTSFFHFFSRKQYAFILDKTLWTIDYLEKSEFPIPIGLHQYSLHQGPTLDQLEEDFFDDRKDCIEMRIEEIARKHAPATPFLVDTASAELARFVIEEIVPSYNPHAMHNLQGTAYLAEGCSPKQPELPKKIAQRRKRQQRANTLLRNMFPHAYYFSENYFYSLRRKTHPQDTKLLHFRGSDFTIGECTGSLDEIERQYQQALEESFYQKACGMAGSLMQRMHTIDAKPFLVQAVIEGHFYDPLSTLGFDIQGKTFYLTQVVEPYVLATNHGGKSDYFEFPKATIGIELRNTDNGVYWCAPIVIEQYVHPCLRDDAPLQQMCLGAFNVLSLRQQGSVRSQILRLLYESRKKLVSGYYGKGGPYNHLSDKRYIKYKRPVFELHANITNEACAS